MARLHWETYVQKHENQCNATPSITRRRYTVVVDRQEINEKMLIIKTTLITKQLEQFLASMSLPAHSGLGEHSRKEGVYVSFDTGCVPRRGLAG